MDGIFKSLLEWKDAKNRKSCTTQTKTQNSSNHDSRWLPHELGALKINVDVLVS